MENKKDPIIGLRYNELLRRYSQVKKARDTFRITDKFNKEKISSDLLVSMVDCFVYKTSIIDIDNLKTEIYNRYSISKLLDFDDSFKKVDKTLGAICNIISAVDGYEVDTDYSYFKSTNKKALNNMLEYKLQDRVTTIFDLLDKFKANNLDFFNENNLDNIAYNIKEGMIEYNKLYKGFKAGVEGEDIVRKVLSRNRSYRTLYNVWLPTDSGTRTEIDAIVITPGGIFVLEVKNTGSDGSTITIESNGDIVYKTPHGDEHLRNYVNQNSLHRETLSNLFYDNGIDVGIVKSALVLTNTNVDVCKNNTELKVVNQTTLGDYIANGSHRNLTREEIESTYNFIEGMSVDDIAFDMFNYKKFASFVMDIEELLVKLDSILFIDNQNNDSEDIVTLQELSDLLEDAPTLDTIRYDLNEFFAIYE